MTGEEARKILQEEMLPLAPKNFPLVWVSEPLSEDEEEFLFEAAFYAEGENPEDNAIPHAVNKQTGNVEVAVHFYRYLMHSKKESCPRARSLGTEGRSQGGKKMTGEEARKILLERFRSIAPKDFPLVWVSEPLEEDEEEFLFKAAFYAEGEDPEADALPHAVNKQTDKARVLLNLC